ncbi:MAG TPA: FAD-binding protein [Solirubrobacteraceae bacterium]|jgi:glycolate oxidase FAD binding subunit|nr:FAD-binding protein [Solirubrobacteraceae bacterium]
MDLPEGIVEYQPGDLTVIAEAGLPLSSLREALAGHGQRLSLDPPGDPTLGECLLEDLSGPLRHRFGTMRDLILGVAVVLGDGLRAHSGGKVVKNVAGYDLGKLFCGSRGRFGSVERLALRLHPLPAASRTIVTGAKRWGELHQSQLVPSAVDIAGGRLHVLLEGSQRAVDAQAAALGGDQADPEATWEELRTLQRSLRGRRRWLGPSSEERDEAPLVRPGPHVAYTDEAARETFSPLAERVAEALWARS